MRRRIISRSVLLVLFAIVSVIIVSVVFGVTKNNPGPKKLSLIEAVNVAQTAEKDFSDGNFQASARLYGQVVASQPDNFAWREKYALALYNAKQLEQAKGEIETIVKQSPANAANWNTLGNIYRDLGEKESALKAYSTAITLQPNYQVAINNKNQLENK